MKTNKTLLNAIIDLGKVTHLTMGNGSDNMEGNGRHMRMRQTLNKIESLTLKPFSHIAYEVEFGTATTLTMGGLSDSLENYRPAPKYK